MDCRLKTQGYFQVSMKKTSIFQGIPDLEGQIPKFKESQALKGKSQNSRNSRPWKKNPQIQGNPGLERKIPKFKESQALKEKSPNSRNPRPWRVNPKIQGIPGFQVAYERTLVIYIKYFATSISYICLKNWSKNFNSYGITISRCFEIFRK